MHTLNDEEKNLVELLLNCLSTQEFDAATALLPLFDNLKDSPSGRNNYTMQHPIPTISEATNNIETSTLDPAYKATLIACINNGMQASSGVDLFSPDSQSAVEALTARLNILEEQERWFFDFRTEWKGGFREFVEKLFLLAVDHKLLAF